MAFNNLQGFQPNKCPLSPHKVSARMTLTAQFDFSDAYGSEDVWTGDLGFLNLGVRYSFNGLNK